MKRLAGRSRIAGAAGLLAGLLVGCSGITVTTHAYLGIGEYPPTRPERVQILLKEPTQPKEKLGEIILSAEGSPSRAALEKRLKKAAAGLGADALFVVFDKTRVFPVVYVDWYWGPTGVSENRNRDIVAVAIKYK